MGAGPAAGPGVAGVQAGTVNDAAQGASTGKAADPSLGSGMALSEQGNRMGDAATAGPPGMADRPPGTGAAPIEPFELPYKVVTSPGARS
jgi:hypothetical protein